MKKLRATVFRADQTKSHRKLFFFLLHTKSVFLLTGEQLQTMADHPNKLAFEEGASYIFNNWTALKLAVEQEWGGVDSVEKKEWFIDTIVDYFGKRGKKLDIDEVEDILYQIMTDEFNTTLEDDSPYLVAKHLIALFNQCIVGNYTEVERLREKAKTQNSFTAASSSIKQGDDDEAEDSDIDGNDNGIEDNDNEEDNDDVMEEATPEEPLVDEDGWETVRRKK
ncbi:Pre-rRNA-processing protein TSR2-domain-containing protein [Mycotypha africana]|uniref:Pre-rRNA-processing protein TSR2-domain-containing protein n=1 Tax=Mycotypha africana TaxID=64632 RepID=UPI002300C24B|nr:Pre-rRNA-processing protein TSR2-domain-containing protein [Mycotypha africana]KAI8969185.1 Pre-rRNA-processing protein TSR2-domain-containing protein [Mycotypha africana]